MIPHVPRDHLFAGTAEPGQSKPGWMFSRPLGLSEFFGKIKELRTQYRFPDEKIDAIQRLITPCGGSTISVPKWGEAGPHLWNGPFKGIEGSVM